MSAEVEFLDPGAPLGFYRYMQWLCEAWQSSGGMVHPNINCPRKVRAALGRTLNFNLHKKRGGLLVCGSHRIESMAFPYNLFHEIVPIMWDLWPGNYEDFTRFINRNKVRLAFCSAQTSVNRLSKLCPSVSFVWLPEAVDVSAYRYGGLLQDRPVDVLSYGRSVGPIKEKIRHVCHTECKTFQEGAGRTFENLVECLSLAKISICYPLVDTNPGKAQGVETLTIRYWEAMLSGTLIVGRAPQELIEVCGYNPVIELGSDPIRKFMSVISDINHFQGLADKNFRTATNIGGWTARLPILKGALSALK